jgi:hypothetical protein
MKKLLTAIALLTAVSTTAQADVEKTVTQAVSYNTCIQKVKDFMAVLPSNVIANQPGVLTTVRILTQDDKSLLVTCTANKMVIVQSTFRG